VLADCVTDWQKHWGSLHKTLTTLLPIPSLQRRTIFLKVASLLLFPLLFIDDDDGDLRQ